MRNASRRKLLKAITLGLGGAVVVGIAVPVLRVLGFPIGKPIVSTPDAPLPVASSDTVIAGAPPVRLAIIADGQRDAYRQLDTVSLGAAWVSRSIDGKLHALSAACPHLGCAIDFDDKERQFRCPCHRSSFAETGVRIAGPVKRDMDPLEVDEADGQVRVRFQRFKPDIAGREPA